MTPGNRPLTNAGFESGSGTNAYDWSQFGTSRSTARAHSGSASLKVDHAVGSVLNAATASYIAVEGSTSYWLSAWVYVQSSSGGNLYLDLDDGHGQGEDFNDVTIAAKSSLVGSWQHITGMFQTAPGTTGVKVRVVHASAASIVAYVDDLTLEKEMGDLEAPQNGMIQQIRDQVNPSYSETYSYDNLYRLVQAESSVWTASWSYDRYGNRLSQTTTGVSYSETLPVSSTSNRVSGWTYDAAGNVTNDGSHTYQYDAENRLIKIDGGSTAQYAYGPQGERVSKIAAGVTTYFYWGIGEKVGGQWTKLYVQGLGGKLVEYSGGVTWFFATNHLGTIAARMNVSGTLMETYRYLPYGERDAGNQTPHQYTGKERDNESGLDYFGARYYASSHGRWMSVDPAIQNLFDPQSLNRFTYVRGNPAKLVDPDGRTFIEWEKGNVEIIIGSIAVTFFIPLSPPNERGGGPGPGVGSIPQPPNPPSPTPFAKNLAAAKSTLRDGLNSHIASYQAGNTNDPCHQLMSALGNIPDTNTPMTMSALRDRISSTAFVDGTTSTLQLSQIYPSNWFTLMGVSPPATMKDFFELGFQRASDPQRQYLIGWTIPSLNQVFLYGQGFQNDQANRSPWAGVNAGTMGHELLHILGYGDSDIGTAWQQFGAQNTGNYSRLIREKCL